ncbi:MAG TPA: hypothetical protein VFH85_07710 [Gammaproteobacteria bacterium]|nr:hypothetical protein [Gammaproteobacteria bacterium]
MDDASESGNLADRACHTLATQSAADGVVRVVACLPTGEYFSGEAPGDVNALPAIFDAVLTEILVSEAKEETRQ